LSASDQPAAAQASQPFSRFEFLLAGRYLRARRKDAFISVISGLTLAGVALGVATLIVVMSVMNGFRTELISKILGLNGDFTAYPIQRQFTDYDQTVKGIRTVPGVTHAVAFVEGQALASGTDDSTGVSVRGMDLDSIKQLPLLYKAIRERPNISDLYLQKLVAENRFDKKEAEKQSSERRDMMRRVLHITGGVAATATVLTQLGVTSASAQEGTPPPAPTPTAAEAVVVAIAPLAAVPHVVAVVIPRPPVIAIVVAIPVVAVMVARRTDIDADARGFRRCHRRRGE